MSAYISRCSRMVLRVFSTCNSLTIAVVAVFQTCQVSTLTRLATSVYCRILWKNSLELSKQTHAHLCDMAGCFWDGYWILGTNFVYFLLSSFSFFLLFVVCTVWQDDLWLFGGEA